MVKDKSMKERGKFKQEIHSALFRNHDIIELILGDTKKLSNAVIRDKFREHVKSHLFIDDTITQTDTFIFYDVVFPEIHTNIKECRIIMYAICHRDILDNYYKEGYYGNRSDILSDMIVDTLINDSDICNRFGIGQLQVDSLDVYNSKRFYGCQLVFSVPNFA